ncbi:MAG: aminoglycoside phosphotransferase family protein [Streptosporangiaceae bacterium]
MAEREVLADELRPRAPIIARAEGGMDNRLARYLAVLSGDGHLVSASTATLTWGQFHDVVLAGDVAYRFPRDEESRRRLPDRVALLTALDRCQLPVTIPDPLDTGHVDRPVGDCYLAVRRLRGEPPAPGPGVAERALPTLVSQFAGMLDELTALGQVPAVRRAVPRAESDHWAQWCEQVRRVLFPLMSASGRRRAEAELAAVMTVAAVGDALVHGDLGGSNLLLATRDAGAVVTGVLDWDEASIGNQACDLASLAVTFGWPVADRIEAVRRASRVDPADRAGPAGQTRPEDQAGREGRARPEGRPMGDEARLIAATFALQQALPGALSGDAESLDDGLSEYR